MENTTATTKRAKIQLNDEERKKLLAAVKGFPCIWDKQRKDHSNRNALSSAWYKIAQIVGKPEEPCKAAWKSLRDSKRYYANKAKKSGSACDLEDLNFASEVTEFEYSEDMAFLSETSSQRVTFSSMDGLGAGTSFDESLDPPGYNYVRFSIRIANS
ncbi:PREDICTED: uncharacterized protein LOC108358638 [Rhagoletis zephyria]|uniref:uncharacterized protein LOC108358638 n=1 Tax=Rhagoletis zephyria TaxID=28612 RepID=UPI0008115224|nr:PREDICTED: uncharacterized protein LOC108358638 [Rhagoletis zephyria]